MNKVRNVSSSDSNVLESYRELNISGLFLDTFRLGGTLERTTKKKL